MADDLTDLLQAGEHAAFHGRPVAGIGPLQEAVALAHAERRDDVAAGAAWLLGVTLGASGRYGSALAVLEPLAGSTGLDDPQRRLFASFAASTAASVHRQLGRHAVARELDTRGLDLSGGSGEAGFDARLGLAADAVGLGEEPAARAELDRAAALTEGRGDWWRQRVRLLWVQAEVALLTGDPIAASYAADAAVELAEASGAPRHVAKSLLFLGVAQVEAGRTEEAVVTLRRAATLAESLGCLPLAWPSRAMLGALLEPVAPTEGARSFAAARSAVLAIAEDLPEDRRDEWLARPDVAALLGT